MGVRSRRRQPPRATALIIWRLCGLSAGGAVQLFVPGFRLEGVTADQEENLLQQLTEITRVMQEGQLVEKLAPGKKSQDGWEGTRTPHHTEAEYKI